MTAFHTHTTVGENFVYLDTVVNKDWSLLECYFFFFTFLGPRIVNVFKQDQQDAKLHNGIYYYKCSTCFRWFLRPSSGAQNCIHIIGYLSSFFCYCEWAGTHNSGKKQKKFDKHPIDAVYGVLSSWRWAEEPPETCRAFVVINTIV